jgi:hypothetical protein
MLDAGVYFAPSAFEAGFVSAAHTAGDVSTTVALAEKVLSPVLSQKMSAPELLWSLLSNTFTPEESCRFRPTPARVPAGC